MMKYLKNIALVILAATLVMTCAGCDKSDTAEPVNIAFVVGIADNETLVNNSMEELVSLPAMPGSDFAFIGVDRTPGCIGEPGTIADLSDRGYTKQMMERVKAGIQDDLAQRLSTYTPDSGEIDMAGAIQLAVRTLKANVTEGRRNVLVFYCSGRSSTGLINMVKTPVYMLDIEASVPGLANAMDLDMSGIEVFWYCCGDVGAGEPAFSPTEKARMKEFYERLFLAMGAESVTFRSDLPSAESYHFADAPVSSIAVEGTRSGLKELVVLDAETFQGASGAALETPVVIPEEQIQYKPDCAEFLNPERASSVLQPVASFLLEHTNVHVLLYGSCAGDNDSAHTLALGKARAESIKDILVAAGIDDDRIAAVTVRVSDDPYHQYGLGTGAEASVNRKTVIVDMSTDLARQIMSHAV